MAGKLELEIIDIFSKDITTSLSINQISKLLKKAYPNINYKVNALIDEEILSKNPVGRSYLCSINLENPKAVALLSLKEAQKQESLAALAKAIRKLAKEFKIWTAFKSDKLYFVLDHIYDRETIKKRLKSSTSIQMKFLAREEFTDMVLENPKILHNTVLYSPEKYFELLSEVWVRLK